MPLVKRIAVIALLALVPTHEAAASWEIGGGAGLFIPWEGSSGLTVAAQLAYLEDERKAWRVGGEFLYRDFDTTVSGVTGVSTQSYSIGVFAHYRILRDFPVVPYLGANARTSVNVIDTDRIRNWYLRNNPGIYFYPLVTDISYGMGIDGVFGLEIPLGGRFIAFAEGRVGYDVDLTNLDSENFGGMTGLGGVRFVFGGPDERD